MKFCIFIFYLFLFSCKTTTNLQDKPTIKIADITAEKWVGGRQESGFGYTLEILLEEPLPKNTRLIQITYKNKTALVKQVNETLFTAKIGTYTTGFKAENNPLEDSINAPDTTKLKPTEALLVYETKNQQKSILLENIKEKTPLYMP